MKSSKENSGREAAAAEKSSGALGMDARKAYAGTGSILVGILLITSSLRGPITSVGPLLEQIQAELAISSGVAGLLTTLPVLAFASVSPFASTLAGRLGLERALFAALIVIVAGLAIRSADAWTALFAGTAIMGAGIALGNVLVPGLIRRDFPNRVAAITGIFTVTMVVVGALGSGLAVPLAEIGGWRFSLLAWVLPALVAMVAWLPRLTARTLPASENEGVPRERAVWRSPLAWQVSLLMGFQASGFYAMITWLPSILGAHGTSAATSGWLLFIFQLASLCATMLVPFLISRARDQKAIGVVCALLLLTGYAGLLLWRDMPLPWMLFGGVGSGGSFVLSLTLFGLRSGSGRQAVALSGMAQTVGYSITAVVPALLGAVHDSAGSWTPPLLIMVVVVSFQTIMAYQAGRPLQVGEA